MAHVEVLYPCEEVRTQLAGANAGKGYAGLSAAVDACRTPAELRWVILGFRRWRREVGPVGEDVTTVWADLSALADASARLTRPGTPYLQWLDRDSAEFAPKIASSALVERLQPLNRMLAEAFEASAELSEKRMDAAASLGFSRVPIEWAPLAMALRSEPRIEEELCRLLGHSPYETLEQNLNALQQALPLPASQCAEPNRLRPDAATSRRLRRLLALCMDRLARALKSWVTGLPTGQEAIQSDGSALGHRFAFAVQRAIARACQLLWSPEGLPPDTTLSTWWRVGQERAEPLTGHKAQMLDLLAVGLPLPGALWALLFEQVSDVLLNIDEKDIQAEELNTILMASLSDDDKAIAELLSQATNALLLAQIPLSQVMAVASGLRRHALPSRTLQRLAWLLDRTWDPGGTGWQGDWVSRWWFTAYQTRMRVTRCLPSPLVVANSLEGDAPPTSDLLGLEPSEMPVRDVDASSLWFLWCCLRSSDAFIPDAYRNSVVWPDCIRRLGNEGFFSTALCLFECWMVHRALYIEYAYTHADDKLNSIGLPDLDDDVLPDDEDLIGLVKDLQTRSAPGRLDGLLHFTAARLGSGKGRLPYLAQQLKALAATAHLPANFKTTAVFNRIERLDKDRMLVRDRLRELMVGYDRLPARYQNELAESERVRDVLFDDSMSGGVNPYPWATTYGHIAEQAVRDAFGRVAERELSQMYESGGGKDWRSAKSLTLGQLRFVLKGADKRPEPQVQIKGRGIEWEALNGTWRERLKWIEKNRNCVAHSEPMPQKDADAWREWMYSGFVNWIEPLGILSSDS